jgi:hypothetical protein
MIFGIWIAAISALWALGVAAFYSGSIVVGGIANSAGSFLAIGLITKIARQMRPERSGSVPVNVAAASSDRILVSFDPFGRSCVRVSFGEKFPRSYRWVPLDAAVSLVVGAHGHRSHIYLESVPFVYASGAASAVAAVSSAAAVTMAGVYGRAPLVVAGIYLIFVVVMLALLRRRREPMESIKRWTLMGKSFEFETADGRRGRLQTGVWWRASKEHEIRALLSAMLEK